LCAYIREIKENLKVILGEQFREIFFLSERKNPTVAKLIKESTVSGEWQSTFSKTKK
jgi:hypothetical protein